MWHFNHIIRLCVVLIAVVIGFFFARGFFVPESFGTYGSYQYGYHRGDSDAEQQNLYALYQGTEKCARCHEQLSKDTQAGGHAAVACETCHGYWQAHNKNTMDKVPRDTSAESCMRCHEKITARPDFLPQISTLAEHLKEQEEAFEPDMKCIDCHNPHVPL
jgi:hypothetical protein